MNEIETTTTSGGPAPTLRTRYLALLTPLVLTHALQSAGGLLDGFWLGRLLGVRGIATGRIVLSRVLLAAVADHRPWRRRDRPCGTSLGRA